MTVTKALSPLASPETIKSFLLDHNVPLHLWGLDGRRSFEHFIETLDHSHVEFRTNEGSSSTPDIPVIDVHVAVAFLRYNESGRLLELIETKQVNHDGDIVILRDLRGVVRIMDKHERPYQCIVRGLRESLGFEDPDHFQLKFKYFEVREPTLSEMWPGLMTAHHRWLFDCEITKKLFCRKGYVEHSTDRDIYFEWKEI